jgi:hypothetical protein
VSPLTRRRLLAAAAAAGAAAAGVARPALATAAPSEPAAIRSLIRREDAAAAAYALAAEATGDALLQRLAGIDARHAHVLRVGLESLTVPPKHRAPHAEQAEPAAARLAAARTTRSARAEAITLEQELLAAYVDSARSLDDAGLLQSVATIAASHAQALAALRDAAGRPPLDEPAVSAG